MLSAGALIWISVRPLLRLVLCTTCGFVITKLDIFPQVAARGVGQILLNITYPCLMFSKIVPAFTSDNIGALGPLVLVAVTYQLIGVAMAWTVKQFFWVPHRFRYGILVAGGWANWGDVPTAVIMSITGNAPFNASTDQSLGVAYVAVFILVFFVSLFPMGGHRLIALDYVGPEVDDEDVRMSVAEKSRESLKQLTNRASSIQRILASKAYAMNAGSLDEADPHLDVEKGEPGITKRSLTEKHGPPLDVISEMVEELRDQHALYDRDAQVEAACLKHVAFQADESTAVPTEPLASQVCSPVQTNPHPSCVPSPAQSITHVDGDDAPPTQPPSFNPNSPHSSSSMSRNASPPNLGLRFRILPHLFPFLRSLLTPQALAIFTAFPIALITPLKSLFTPVPDSTIPNAPDGQPPLAFLLDTATFIGAASVPLGLISLGSALARLKVPKGQWRSLPLGAISWLAIAKMAVMPVLGVLIVQGLVHAGVIKPDQKVLRFVCIFIACTPTATTQVFLTQVYSGTGSAETLSAFLIPQYTLMFVTMTILCAYTLALLF